MKHRFFYFICIIGICKYALAWKVKKNQRKHKNIRPGYSILIDVIDKIWTWCVWSKRKINMKYYVKSWNITVMPPINRLLKTHLFVLYYFSCPKLGILFFFCYITLINDWWMIIFLIMCLKKSDLIDVKITA